MPKLLQRFCILISMLTLVTGSLSGQEKLPLDAFAMLPMIKQVSVSPNGKKVGVVRSLTKEGFYVLAIYDTADLTKKPKQYGGGKMEITNFSWANDTKIFLSFRQNIKTANSNRWENRSIILDVKSGDMGQMIGAKSVGKVGANQKRRNNRIRTIRMLPNDKNHILLSMDLDNDRKNDVVKFNVKTYSMRPIYSGNSKFNGGLILDSEGEVRGAVRIKFASKTIEYHARVKGENKWKKIGTYDAKSRESFGILGFDDVDPNKVFVSGTFGENTAGIYMYNLKTDVMSDRQFGLKSVDVGGIIRSRKANSDGKVLGFTYTTSKPKRYYIDAEEGALYESVQALFKGKYISIRSRSEDDNEMVIYTESDRDPGTYYLLMNKSELKYLGETYPLQKKEHLSKVKYIKYTARDGLKIPAYVTYPKGDGPHPVVVMPHGGPWARDVVINDQWSQYLAYHGYLVIQPQYRGSTGYGLAHLKAGDAQWGLTMQDDLDDAAMYLVNKGLGDKDRLAMYGWSYGGYAAMVASQRNNNIYQCAIAGAGVGDLDAWRAVIYNNRIGRVSQRPFVDGINPLDNVANVNIPILVIHGSIDHQVETQHSRDFVSKLKSNNKDHKYVEIEGLDHFSNRFGYEHNKVFYSELLNWLDNKCFNEK